MKSRDDESGARPGLGRTLRSDLAHGGFWSSVKRDGRELKEYSLTEAESARLAGMGSFRRSILSTWWVLRQMILHLTPARRLLVVFGILLLFVTTSVQHDDRVNSQPIVGGLVLLFVLLLELKDRLLAWDELQAGRTVQRELLPDTTPDLPGWSVWISTEPANDVGGDLVDFLPLTSGRTGLVIGDVSGKGLSAALLMAKLQTIVRTLSAEYDTPSDVVSHTNDAFRRERLPNVFASMIYVEVSDTPGRIRYANAGHPPPFLVHDGAVSTAEKGDAAIGLMAGSAYAERTIDLVTGDLFICYSDGLTEARNEKGEFFGTDRIAGILPLLTALSAPDIGNGLLNAVRSFAGDIHPHDDLSLVILKRI